MFQSFISYSLGYPKFLEEQLFSWTPPRIWLLTSRQLPNYSKAIYLPWPPQGRFYLSVYSKHPQTKPGPSWNDWGRAGRLRALFAWPLSAPFQRGTQKTFLLSITHWKQVTETLLTVTWISANVRGKAVTGWSRSDCVPQHSRKTRRMCTVHRPSCYQHNRRKGKKPSLSVIHLSPQSQEGWLPEFLNGWSVCFFQWPTVMVLQGSAGKGVLLRKMHSNTRRPGRVRPLYLLFHSFTMIILRWGLIPGLCGIGSNPALHTC